MNQVETSIQSVIDSLKEYKFIGILLITIVCVLCILRYMKKIKPNKTAITELYDVGGQRYESKKNAFSSILITFLFLFLVICLLYLLRKIM